MCTSIHCKPANVYEYLPNHGAHPEHTKSNIPYALAKRMIVLVSSPEKMKYVYNNYIKF